MPTQPRNNVGTRVVTSPAEDFTAEATMLVTERDWHVAPPASPEFKSDVLELGKAFSEWARDAWSLRVFSKKFSELATDDAERVLRHMAQPCVPAGVDVYLADAYGAVGRGDSLRAGKAYRTYFNLCFMDALYRRAGRKSPVDSLPVVRRKVAAMRATAAIKAKAYSRQNQVLAAAIEIAEKRTKPFDSVRQLAIAVSRRTQEPFETVYAFLKSINSG